MTSSTGSLDTTASSRPAAFSFLTQFSSSFSDLLNGAGGGDDAGDQSMSRVSAGPGGIPKFKSVPPPSLPISPPAISSSSYFTLPAGLNHVGLLDSPVLSSSNFLPSPTTGTFPSPTFNWKAYSDNYQQVVNEEDRDYSAFSFQQPSSAAMSTQAWNYQQQQQPNKKTSEFSALKPNNIKPELVAPNKNNNSSELSSTQSNLQSNGGDGGHQSYCSHLNQAAQTLIEERRSGDGYNWRKYGQKHVKGSENPRSYYKCTHTSCPTKKKVEKSLDGHITEIVYKGTHNHPKPQSTRRKSSYSSSQQIQLSGASAETSDHSPFGSVAMPENSSVSLADDDLDMRSHRSRSAGGDEFDDDEADAKRWKKEGENEEGISGAGNRTVREPRIVVQTRSDIDILDDGYRWRKYGQKVVKGNPNPRSYYKCTSVGCSVRKHVERASHDLSAVITTYEGKHSHDVPAARGSGARSVINRPPSTDIDGGDVITRAIRPSALANHANNHTAAATNQTAPFTLEMLRRQTAPVSYGFSGFDNSAGSYISQLPQHVESSVAKEELRDDNDCMFPESLFC